MPNDMLKVECTEGLITTTKVTYNGNLLRFITSMDIHLSGPSQVVTAEMSVELMDVMVAVHADDMEVSLSENTVECLRRFPPVTVRKLARRLLSLSDELHASEEK